MKDINNQKGLNSIWIDSLARNLHPDGNALVDHLRTVHQEHAGFTEACASSCRDEAGRNSYEWLAELVPANKGSRVLDLACGSGPLLKILFDRNKNLNLNYNKGNLSAYANTDFDNGNLGIKYSFAHGGLASIL